MRTFRDLKVWQKAHGLVLGVYKVTKGFPKEEKFGLVSQIRRLATSVPTNIVEGFKRKSDKGYAHFLNLADSSLEETKYHLILALDLGYIDSNSFESLISNPAKLGKCYLAYKESLILRASPPAADRRSERLNP